MGGSSGTSAAVNNTAVNQNNAAQNGLQAYSGAGSNQAVQNILSQYAQGGGGGIQGALAALGGIKQPGSSPGAAGTQAQYTTQQQQALNEANDPNSLIGSLGQSAPMSQALQDSFGKQNALTGAAGQADTSGSFNRGAIDQLFSSPETGSLVAQQQVMSNPLYAGLFGAGGVQNQAENNMQTQTATAAGQNALAGQQNQLAGTQNQLANQQTGQSNEAFNNYQGNTQNLASDRNALSGRDPSYGLQASDLAAYGQASNAIGRNSAQQGQGIAQALAARGLGSSNNGAAIGSYAGNYGNQAEQLAGLQQQIAQSRIQTAQGLAQARNQSDLQQQQTNSGLATNFGQLANSSANTANNTRGVANQTAGLAIQNGQLANQSGGLANTIGQTGMNAQNSQYANNMEGVQNDYNTQAGAAGAALNNQSGSANLNNSQFAQQQATKTPDFGTQLGNGLLGGLTGGLTGGISNGITKGLSSALK